MTWIQTSKRSPKIPIGRERSETVLAIVNDNIEMMAVERKEIGSKTEYWWVKVFDGVSIYDDEYNPTHWRRLPDKPVKIKQEFKSS